MNKKLNKIKTKVNLKNLNFNKSKKLGEGSFGSVYKLSNNKRTNKKYVVKKIKDNLNLKIISFLGTGKTQKQLLDKEITALIELSKHGISPKVYYYDKKKMVYVIDRLDSDLYTMIKKNLLKPYHINKLIDLFKKLQTTKYKHNDLHSGNIMYSKLKKKFFIIDLGLYTLINDCDVGTKECFKYSEYNAKLLFDLFLFIKAKYNSTKNYKIMNQYKNFFTKLSTLFNIEDKEFRKNFLNNNLK